MAGREEKRHTEKKQFFYGTYNASCTTDTTFTSLNSLNNSMK